MFRSFELIHGRVRDSRRVLCLNFRQSCRVGSGKLRGGVEMPRGTKVHKRDNLVQEAVPIVQNFLGVTARFYC